jgi:hypothetical protein
MFIVYGLDIICVVKCIIVNGIFMNHTSAIKWQAGAHVALVIVLLFVNWMGEKVTDEIALRNGFPRSNLSFYAGVGFFGAYLFFSKVFPPTTWTSCLSLLFESLALGTTLGVGLEFQVNRRI